MFLWWNRVRDFINVQGISNSSMVKMRSAGEFCYLQQLVEYAKKKKKNPKKKRKKRRKKKFAMNSVEVRGVLQCYKCEEKWKKGPC